MIAIWKLWILTMLLNDCINYYFNFNNKTVLVKVRDNWGGDSYPLSGGTGLADWHRKHRFQIQKLWCDPGPLQSNQCSYWSNGGLESGPGVRSFPLLPGHQYWGSLKCTERHQSQCRSRDLQYMSQLWSKVVAQQAIWVSWHRFPLRCKYAFALPQCLDYFSQLLA